MLLIEPLQNPQIFKFDLCNWFSELHKSQYVTFVLDVPYYQTMLLLQLQQKLKTESVLFQMVYQPPSRTTCESLFLGSS